MSTVDEARQAWLDSIQDRIDELDGTASVSRIGDRLKPYKATTLTERQRTEYRTYWKLTAAERLELLFPMHEGVRKDA